MNPSADHQQRNRQSSLDQLLKIYILGHFTFFFFHQKPSLRKCMMRVEDIGQASIQDHSLKEEGKTVF